MGSMRTNIQESNIVTALEMGNAIQHSLNSAEFGEIVQHLKGLFSIFKCNINVKDMERVTREKPGETASKRLNNKAANKV